jgi:Uncharacterized conserved protein (COG2071)
VFLTAEWRALAMLNYEVDASLLRHFVPAGTELDCWQGKTLVSLVGFRFLKTRVLGIPIPFHRNFDEVNLRFYVRRAEATEVKRGVVFIREIVPRRAIAAVARAFYNERYLALPCPTVSNRTRRGSRSSMDGSPEPVGTELSSRRWDSRRCRGMGRRSSSSLNIIGDMRAVGKIAVSNIGSSTLNGKFGEHLKPCLKATRRNSTERNSLRS